MKGASGESLARQTPLPTSIALDFALAGTKEKQGRSAPLGTTFSDASFNQKHGARKGTEKGKVIKNGMEEEKYKMLTDVK